MSDIEVVSGDTAPTVYATLKKKNADGSYSVRTLSDVASIKFQMRRRDDRRFTVNASAAIVDAATGSVSYNWAAGDLSVAGEFQCQWELTLLDGKIQTTTPPSTITIRRQ
jgi:hypothetical protein